MRETYLHEKKFLHVDNCISLSNSKACGTFLGMSRGFLTELIFPDIFMFIPSQERMVLPLLNIARHGFPCSLVKLEHKIGAGKLTARFHYSRTGVVLM